jgi:hypothetical protein
MLSWHKLSWIALAVLLCLYLLFPSGSSSADGWYSAASIRHGGEIFHPHHLLYNALGLVFSWLPAKAGIETLAVMKMMNAIFAFLMLIVIYKILCLFKIGEKQIFLIICLAGFSFSILRYATENETYIIPLFFALLASLNFGKFLAGRNNRFAIYAGLWATLAVLFHETYIFWWIGLLAGLVIEKRNKALFLYVVASLAGPLSYLYVIFTNEGSGWHQVISFLLGNFNGNASLGLSLKGLFLSFINLLRSFIQVHGYILNMIRENALFTVPAIVSLILVLLSLFNAQVIIRSTLSSRFSTVHILIILLQFTFAVFSYGNAEFMVMIPVLVFMLIPFFVSGFEKSLLWIIAAMIVWNLSYGLIPVHFKSQAPEEFLCSAALSGKNAIIVASDDQLIKSMIYYRTGEDVAENILKSPAVLRLRGEGINNLEAVIDSVLISGNDVFTNCLDKEVVSRQSIMEGNVNIDFFQKYKMRRIKSWKQYTGTKSVYKVERKL